MKEISINTPGGRIRHARQETGMTIRQMANKIGVTSGHLGLVERNEKRASPTLLQKIAETTGIDIDWLESAPDIETPTPTREKILPTDLDMQLFLTILTLKDPTITADKLAFILQTNELTIRKIIEGETVTIPSKWEDGLALLTKRIDIFDLQSKLKTITKYLQQISPAESTENSPPV